MLEVPGPRGGASRSCRSWGSLVRTNLTQTGKTEVKTRTHARTLAHTTGGKLGKACVYICMLERPEWLGT